MPLVLDAYNVLHVSGVLPPDMAGMGPHDLVETISGSRYRGQSVWMVFDGLPTTILGQSPRMIDAYRPAPMEIGDAVFHFSGPRSTADAVIAELVERSSAPTRLLVVSSDHAVQRTARRRRCKVLDSAAFLEQLVHDVRHGPPRDRLGGKPSGPLSRDQVQAWLRYFGVESSEPTPKPLAPPLPRLHVTDHTPTARRTRRPRR